jgi:hypothetical protein
MLWPGFPRKNCRLLAIMCNSQKLKVTSESVEKGEGYEFFFTQISLLIL